MRTACAAAGESPTPTPLRRPFAFSGIWPLPPGFPPDEARMAQKPLTPRHERFAAARAEGKTIAASAALAGVSERSGKTWDDDERVVVLVARLRQQRDARIAAKVGAQVERLLDTGALPTNQLIDLYKATALKGALTVEHTGTVRHEHEHRDLSIYTDEEIASLRALKRKHLAAKGAG